MSLLVIGNLKRMKWQFQLNSSITKGGLPCKEYVICIIPYLPYMYVCLFFNYIPDYRKVYIFHWGNVSFWIAWNNYYCHWSITVISAWYFAWVGMLEYMEATFCNTQIIMTNFIAHVTFSYPPTPLSLSPQEQYQQCYLILVCVWECLSTGSLSNLLI